MYTKDLVDKLDISKLKEMFIDIPIDEYLEEGYRFKKITRFTILDNGEFYIQEHAPLYQDSTYNPTHGDIMRHYPEVEEKFSSSVSVKELLREFSTLINLKKGDDILFQAQRIICNNTLEGHPAVEGWHQDNVDYIGLLCVERYNILGGVSKLSTSKNEEEEFFSDILKPGVLLFFNDKTNYHYTTPIVPLDTNIGEGYRDVILLGTPSCSPLTSKNITSP